MSTHRGLPHINHPLKTVENAIVAEALPPVEGNKNEFALLANNTTLEWNITEQRSAHYAKATRSPGFLAKKGAGFPGCRRFTEMAMTNQKVYIRRGQLFIDLIDQ